MAVRRGPDGGGRPTVRQVMADRRFRLGALPAGMRPGAVAVLVVIIAWSAVIALDAAGGEVTADALGATGFGLMGVPGWEPPAVRVGTVAALGLAVVVAAGAATAAGWPEGRATRLVRRGVLAGGGLAGLALVTRASLDADGLWAELLTGPAGPVGPARWAAASRVVDRRPVAMTGRTTLLLVALLCLPGLAAGVLLGLYRPVRDLTTAGPYDLAARVAIVLAVAVLAGGLLVLRATAEGRGRPAGPGPALVALGTAGLLGTLVGGAMLAELIQRSEDNRTAATAWGARQAVGLSLQELAGGIAATTSSPPA